MRSSPERMRRLKPGSTMPPPPAALTCWARWSLGKRRTVLLFAGVVVVSACFGALLYAVTEPWRVYGNDYRPFFWTLTVLPATVAIAMAGLRWPRMRLLVILLVPLFVVLRQQIINQRLQDSVTSCGNHSSFWGSFSFDGMSPLPSSTEFADFLLAVHQDEGVDPLRGRRCPGYKRAGTKTGVVFVAGGLRLAALPGEDVLLAFCSWKCHSIPYDHQHCLVWEGGVFRRQCSETRDMIGRLERALRQAEQGIVPYSKEACALLTHELQSRKALVGGRIQRNRAANGRQPIRVETNRTSSAADFNEQELESVS